MDHAWIRHLSGEKIKQRSKRLKALAIYIDVPSLKLLLDSILSDDLASLSISNTRESSVELIHLKVLGSKTIEARLIVKRWETIRYLGQQKESPA